MTLSAITAALLLSLVVTGGAGIVQPQKGGTVRPGQTARQSIGSLRLQTGHKGSVVYLNQIRHGSTGDDGVLSLARVPAGSYSLRVRTTGFADWRGSIVVRPGSVRTVKVDQLVTADPAVLAFQRGEELRDRGEHLDAVREYHKAIALNPGFAEARVALTRSLVTLQEFQEAEEQIGIVLRSGGASYPEAQTVLANMRRGQGLTDEAIEEYEKALRLTRGTSSEAHIGLALALQEAGEINEAIGHFRSGIARNMDTEAILYYLLGSALEKAGKRRDAIEAYRHYLRLEPDGQYSSAVESIIERLKEEIR